MIRMKDAIDSAIIIISLIERIGNIILVSPPKVRTIKARSPIKRAKEDNIAAMIGIVFFLLRVIVNTPTAVYTMALNIARINIAKKNINPAIKPAIAPAIASPMFPALISIPKLNITAKDSISRNNKAKIVTVLKSSNTPIIILNDLIKFIIYFHFHFGFQRNNIDI